MNRIRHIIYLLTVMVAMTACTDDFTVEEGTSSSGNDGKGIGEMVQFAVGTTEHTLSRASDGKTYYMPDSYRFVCRMYYKAQMGQDTLDITGGTDQTAWLKVSGNVGNSLYWNKAYTTPTNYDSYGNDYNAKAFYWQNRKEHAFLAWTNLNKATSIKGGSAKETLKFDSDLLYKFYTGEKREEWVHVCYKIYGLDKEFNSMTAMREYVEKNVTDIDAFNAKQREIGGSMDWSDAEYLYQFGWSCKHTSSNCITERQDDKHETYGWYQYMMFFDKKPFEETITDYIPVKDADGIITNLADAEGVLVAEAEAIKDEEGNYLDSEGNITTTPADYTYKYYAMREGTVLYDEDHPRYTFYYKHYLEKKSIDVYNEYPALAFDLTRGSKTNMAQQPDIAQAREIQAPVGATQESNRVNLYFKHQFSQIQVNIKNAADNSVGNLESEDILKVELLGVTEEGYVFTEMDKDGNVRPAAYKEIDFSKYSEADLKANQYGTSFSMFPMDETATGYLKSFNAIAYGQLQAIRITWRESDTGYEHAATYRIPNTELMNLKSAMRYIWNIEVRRGTLAIIRTEIVDWELPEDEFHNGSTDGTIQN